MGQRLAKLEGVLQADRERRVREDQQLDKKFETQNEIRAALSDLSKLMMTKDEYFGRHQALEQAATALSLRLEQFREEMEKRISFNTTRLDRLEGKSGGFSTLFSWLLALGAMMVTAAVGWLSYLHSVK
jgi:hypothetical protein